MALINYLPVEKSKDEEKGKKNLSKNSKKRKIDPKEFVLVII